MLFFLCLETHDECYKDTYHKKVELILSLSLIYTHCDSHQYEIYLLI